MIYYDAQEVAGRLPYAELIRHLRDAFAGSVQAPLRGHYAMSGGARSRELLTMPAWNDQSVAVKLITVFPDNVDAGLPAINGVVVLFDGKDGRPLAMVDAGELTVRRTAAASALASSFLSRADSRRLLVVGTGRLAPHLAAAHCAVRDIGSIAVCGRTMQKAEDCAGRVRGLVDNDVRAVALADIQSEVQCADIVSLATRSNEALVRGNWTRDGQHFDLVGGYRPDMREVDDDCIRAARIYVDTREAALHEAGDLVQPIAGGVISADSVVAELAELCRGTGRGRTSDREITLFKSVGTAIEDLAAAELVAGNP